MPEQSGKITRIIACMVFKPALDSLQVEGRFPNVRVTYLPSNMHLKPHELKNRLLEEYTSAKERNEQAFCLYGDCIPDIDGFCEQHGAIKVPGHYCYEMLLGSERFKQFIEEITGTYFAEKDLIENFDKYCTMPLELHDEEMRNYCFKQYSKLLYIRQPSDPDLVPRAVEIADFLNLSLDISDADYSHLENILTELLRSEF